MQYKINYSVQNALVHQFTSSSIKSNLRKRFVDIGSKNSQVHQPGIDGSQATTCQPSII